MSCVTRVGRRTDALSALRRPVLLAAAAAIHSAASPLFAATSTYIGPNGGDWATASYWSPTGVPAALEDVLFAPSGSGSYTFDSDYLEPSGALDGFTFGGSGSSPTLTQTANHFDTSADTFNDGTFIINGGEGGADFENFETATFIQNAGTHSTNILDLGLAPFGTSTFSLNGGTLNVRNWYVGAGAVCNGFVSQTGTSTVNQTDVSALVALGTGAASAGTYNFSGGTLNLAELEVGTAGGNGTFNQSGTTTVNQVYDVNSTAEIDLGSGSHATGLYTVSGGTINGRDIVIGLNGGAGTLAQSGTSTLNLPDGILIGNDSTSSGTYTISGGTLTGAGPDVGAGGNGVMLQSGGTLNVNAIGVGDASTALGVYTFSGGRITTPSITVGIDGLGSMIQTGSTALNDISGDLVLALDSTAAGTYAISAGTLLASGIDVGEAGAATFTQSGASTVNLFTGLIAIAGGSTSTGIYSLSGGTLELGTMEVGTGGTASFVQTAGYANLSNLYVGSASVGSVTLSGGSLITAETIVGGTVSIAANFTQSGSLTSSNLGTLGIGGAGPGTFSISAGTLVAGATFIGIIPGSGTIGLMHVPQVGTYIQSGSLTYASLGPTALSFSGALQLSGGTIDVTNINSSGTIDLNGGTLIVLEGTGGGTLGPNHVPTSGTLGTSIINRPLTIAPGATMDLTTHAMVINYNGQTGANLDYEGIPSPIGELTFNKHTPTQAYPTGSITRYIQTACDNDNWDLPGLTSSVAGADETGVTSLGVVDENDLYGLQGNDYTTAHGGTGTWEGAAISNDNNVLVRFTYTGDTNLDGVVNGIDVDNLIQGFEGFGDGWLYGDFNYDGIINSLDVTEMIIGYTGQGKPLGDAISPGQAQFLLSLSSGLSAAQIAKFDAIVGVPEPATIGLLGAAAAAAGLLGRRRASTDPASRPARHRHAKLS